MKYIYWIMFVVIIIVTAFQCYSCYEMLIFPGPYHDVMGDLGILTLQVILLIFGIGAFASLIWYRRLEKMRLGSYYELPKIIFELPFALVLIWVLTFIAFRNLGASSLYGSGFNAYTIAISFGKFTIFQFFSYVFLFNLMLLEYYWYWFYHRYPKKAKAFSNFLNR